MVSTKIRTDAGKDWRRDMSANKANRLALLVGPFPTPSRGGRSSLAYGRAIVLLRLVSETYPEKPRTAPINRLEKFAARMVQRGAAVYAVARPENGIKGHLDALLEVLR
jgi:hypothetical protein